MEKELILKDEKASEEFASKFSNFLKKGDVLSLEGDLGTGKTFFTQNICKNLGVKDYITSPTFVLLNEYVGNFQFFHFDLYRLGDTEEVFELGIPDIFDEGVTFIEWPKIAKPLLPKNTYYLEFSYYGEKSRKVKIKNITEEMWKKLKN